MDDVSHWYGSMAVKEFADFQDSNLWSMVQYTHNDLRMVVSIIFIFLQLSPLIGLCHRKKKNIQKADIITQNEE